MIKPMAKVFYGETIVIGTNNERGVRILKKSLYSNRDPLLRFLQS